MVKVARYCSILFGRNRKQAGFLLAELQISVAIMAVLVAVLYSDFCQLLQGWQKMFLDIQLQDTGRYMFSILEKDLCYEGQLITLDKDSLGNPKITCRTGHAGKSYTYTLNSKSLYKTTKTTKTSGKNPLFVPGCNVMDLQAERLGEKLLGLEITLEKDGRRQKLSQIMHCFNGSVVYE